MTKIKYPLEAGDQDRMLEIERLSFSSPWSEEDIRHALLSRDGMRCLGLCEEETLIGWGCFRLGFGEAHLTTVAIHPVYRRKGFGRKLTSALLQAASDAGATYMELECRRGNHAAQELYKSLHFLRAGIRYGYYTDTGEDALIYVNINLPEGDSERDPFLIRE